MCMSDWHGLEAKNEAMSWVAPGIHGDNVYPMHWYGIRFQGLAEVGRVPRQNAKTRPNSSILRPLHLHYTPTLLTLPIEA